MYARPEIRAGVARLAAHGLVLDARCYHPQLADVISLARALPQVTIVMCHVGGVLGYGAYAGKRRSSCRMAGQHGGVGHMSERLRQARRHAEPRRRAQFPRASDAAEFCDLAPTTRWVARRLFLTLASTVFAQRKAGWRAAARPEPATWRWWTRPGCSAMPLDAAPPRSTRFGSPLVLSRVHWVRPELVAEVKFLAWTEDNLLRQVVYEGLREDKPAREARREIPHPKPGAGDKSAPQRRPRSR